MGNLLKRSAFGLSMVFTAAATPAMAQEFPPGISPERQQVIFQCEKNLYDELAARFGRATNLNPDFFDSDENRDSFGAAVVSGQYDDKLATLNDLNRSRILKQNSFLADARFACMTLADENGDLHTTSAGHKNLSILIDLMEDMVNTNIQFYDVLFELKAAGDKILATDAQSPAPETPLNMPK